MKKQIKLYHIVKIQAAYMREFEALDDDFPNRQAVMANERAIQYWLNKITDNREEQINIFRIIKDGSWDTADTTFKPICDRLRELGYEILEGTK